MFGPLAFQENTENNDTNSYSETKCLLCNDSFNLKLCLPIFLKHIFEVHQLVIEDAQNIDNFPEYIAFWRDKFAKTPIEQIIPAISVSLTSSKFFILSNLTKDDKDLRHKLKLEKMLKTQEFERNDDDFTKQCLFCKLNFKGKRCDYLIHLSEDHNIRLGNPQNLVYIDELLQRISENLEALQCLYCEKTFPDRVTLKEHMRKKQHKRIHPSNQSYDKYYAVNYLDPDRKWHTIEKEADVDVPQQSDAQDNSDEEYNGWTEAAASIVCLFCNLKDSDINKLCLHMNSKHRFNFYTVTKHLDFYQKVKFVNYVRRQIHKLHCVYCDADFEDNAALDTHMEKEKHYCLPDLKVFDQPEFYFPTYENDSFLCFLEEIED